LLRAVLSQPKDGASAEALAEAEAPTRDTS
jgi:hypothetical protein